MAILVISFEILIAILMLATGTSSSVDSYCDYTYVDDVDTFKSNKVCATADCVTIADAMLSSINFSVNPCDNFYEFACGKFRLRHSIPAGMSQYDKFYTLDRVVKRQLLNLLQSPGDDDSPRSAQSKARIYFKSCMDMKRIEAAAVPTMREMTVELLGGLYLDKSKVLPQKWNLNKLLKQHYKYSLDGFFSLAVGPDDKNVRVNIIQLQQSGLGLGSRDYYLEQEQESMLEAYIEYLHSLAKIINGKDSRIDDSSLSDVVFFEKKLAAIHKPLSEQVKVAKNYFKTEIDWLQKNANFLNWFVFFNDLFGPRGISINNSEPILLYGHDFFIKLASIINEYLSSVRGKRTLQNYLVFKVTKMYSPFLGGAFQKACDRLQAVLTGTKGSLERWRICIGDTDSNVGFGVGSLYLEKHFPAAAKMKMVAVTNNLIKTFRKRIENARWMDSGTRKRALEKVDTLAFDVGYPDWIRNQTHLDDYYAKLTVTRNYARNQILSVAFFIYQHLTTLRKKSDSYLWELSPQIVNAFYKPTSNKVIVPAGILRSPFFYTSKGTPESLNFGAIGFVVAHEIAHGFDDTGREYDKFGNLNDWWSDTTRKRFERRTKCLIDQFSAYRIDGLQLRGDQLLSENIADDAAIKTSFRAFRELSYRESDATTIVGANFSQEQLFFVNWAQTWCSIYTPEMIRYRVLQDTHALAQFRIRGTLSNFIEFAKAFQCSAVQAKVKPSERCSVW